MANRRIFVLVGPKGAGKTFLGAAIHREFGVPFVRVEDIWLELKKENALQGKAFDDEGQRRTISALHGPLNESGSVVIESTGAAPWLGEFLDRLKALGDVHLIRVRVPLDVCLRRVQRRDASLHIPVSDDRVREINAIADKISLPWALEIDNSDDVSPEAIVAAFKNLFL